MIKNGTMSQVRLNDTPEAIAKIITTVRFIKRLINAVVVAERTIIHFGNAIFLIKSERRISDWMPWFVHSVKKLQRTVPVKR